MTIKFIIAGNHADRDGNPIPKLKMTGRQHWTDKAKAYVAWKEYVKAIFLSELKKENPKFSEALSQGRFLSWVRRQKPLIIEKDQNARMDLKIWWANEKHPDPENVFGSIADALFENDKHLDGSFEAEHHPEGKGRVEVKIEIK